MKSIRCWKFCLFSFCVVLASVKMIPLELSNKIRVVADSKKIENVSEHELKFYANYASAVSDTLKKPLFQKFLHWIIKKEEIEKKFVKDIQVRVFPFQKENGNSLAGRCNSTDGVILIFPKKHSYVEKKLENHKKRKVRFYLKNRAMAALIHELLHVKYEGNENKVRKLTEKYFHLFNNRHKPDVSIAKTPVHLSFSGL